MHPLLPSLGPRWKTGVVPIAAGSHGLGLLPSRLPAAPQTPCVPVHLSACRPSRHLQGALCGPAAETRLRGAAGERVVDACLVP